VTLNQLLILRACTYSPCDSEQTPVQNAFQNNPSIQLPWQPMLS